MSITNISPLHYTLEMGYIPTDYNPYISLLSKDYLYIVNVDNYYSIYSSVVKNERVILHVMRDNFTTREEKLELITLRSEMYVVRKYNNGITLPLMRLEN